jgi:hypothetical protein
MLRQCHGAAAQQLLGHNGHYALATLLVMTGLSHAR